MKVKVLLLAVVGLSALGMVACSGQTEPGASEETAVQQPALIMFYTDN